MTCSLSNICSDLYKVTCTDKCTLALDIQERRVDPVSLQLKINGDRKVICPRSPSKIKLSNKCNLQDCPYQNDKLTFGCMLIHKEVFFHNKEIIPNNILEVVFETDRKTIKKLKNVSIYLARLIMLLSKYHTDTINSTAMIGTHKVILCETCSGIYLEDCSCKDKEIRNGRRRLNNNWKKMLEKSRDMPWPSIGLKAINNKIGLELIRSNILKIKESIGVTEVNLGFLLNNYIFTFENHKYKTAEALGMTKREYKVACSLFQIF